MSTNDSLYLPIDDSYSKLLLELKEQFGVQYYNIRFSARNSTSLHINKGNMKTAHSLNNYGFSVYAFIDGGYGFSVSNTINTDEIKNKFEEAAKLAKFASKKAEMKFLIDELDPIKVKFVQPQKKNLLDVSSEEKVKFLLEEDKKALNFDKRIVNTESSYADSVEHQIIITSDDRFIDLTQSYARTFIFAYSQEGDVNQSSRASLGITGGFELADMAKGLGETAGKRAIEILSAKPVKGGQYTIISDPLLTGTFTHEAFGHACEADGILAGESQLEGKIGERVGHDYINIYDDPQIESAYGSIKYDSEGVKARKVHLVKDGVLNEFMHSRETASKMHEQPTGNARAMAYSSTPIVRMRSTYLEEGDWELDEMLGDMKDGLLCINWLYGYTDPSTGQFMFKMERAWKIEHGEKTQLIRDAAISGDMLSVLDRITAISKNKDFDDGTCGKMGQSVPVTSGGPYTKINGVIIGGM